MNNSRIKALMEQDKETLDFLDKRIDHLLKIRKQIFQELEDSKEIYNEK